MLYGPQHPRRAVTEVTGFPKLEAASSPDLWLLAFHPDELDDGGARKGPRGGAVHVDEYLNGESVVGAGIVLWTHAMDRLNGTRRVPLRRP